MNIVLTLSLGRNLCVSMCALEQMLCGISMWSLCGRSESSVRTVVTLAVKVSVVVLFLTAVSVLLSCVRAGRSLCRHLRLFLVFGRCLVVGLRMKAAVSRTGGAIVLAVVLGVPLVRTVRALGPTCWSGSW